MPGIYAAAKSDFAAALSWTLALAQAHAAEITPEVFAPGIVPGPNHEAAAAFTPDGSKPKIAPLWGVWSDIEPAMDAGFAMVQ
jgi:hypothetical protein